MTLTTSAGVLGAAVGLFGVIVGVRARTKQPRGLAFLGIELMIGPSAPVLCPYAGEAVAIIISIVAMICTGAAVVLLATPRHRKA